MEPRVSGRVSTKSQHDIVSGQFITTSAEVTPNGGLVRESPQNFLKLGSGFISNCPDCFPQVFCVSKFNLQHELSALCAARVNKKPLPCWILFQLVIHYLGGSKIKNQGYISTWNPKQPFINGCFNWMIPNLYIGNGCFTKHLFINGCLGFQAYIS